MSFIGKPDYFTNMFPSWNPLDEGMFEIVLMDRYWCDEAEEWLEMPDYIKLGFISVPESIICTVMSINGSI